MTDFTTRARETAEREGLARIPPRMMALHGGVTVDNMRFYRDYYIEGFTSAVSRLPSEEEICSAILGRTATAGARAVRELIEKKMVA